MLDRLQAAGLVRSGGRQRTGSTHVIAPGCAGLNRVETVGERLRAGLEAIAWVSPAWVAPGSRPLLGIGWDER